MKKMILVFMILCGYSQSHSQNTTINTQIEVGGLRGIQLSKTFPILKSGGFAEIGITKSLGDYVQLGLGTAYLKLENERFIPLFLKCIAHKRNQKNSPYFAASIGFARATSADFDNSLYNNYVGKVYFSPGFGYYYKVNKKWGLTAGLSYVLQKVDLENLHSDGEIYHTESLTIDLISFKVGIHIH